MKQESYSKKENTMKSQQMSDQIKQYSDCSSDEEILLPMCNILPANQIITKTYAPDQSPVIKFIPKQILKQKQALKNSFSLGQVKKLNPEFQQYANLFGSQDFLGKFYADQLSQMIYLKFDNKEYNQLKINQKKYRFFSGFFVQKEHFQDVAQQKYDNIMKSFPQIDFVDYNSNLLLSFGKNNKGCLQDPRFSSNYDSANLFAVIKKKPFEYDLILQNDMNSKGNNQWFNFLVNFSEQGTYKFNIVNFTKSHSLYQKGMRIACYSFTKQMQRGNPENYKNGSGWFKGGKNIKYFRNGIQRQSQGSNTSYYTLSFEFTCKQQPESIVFAYTFPYSGLELEKYFNKMLYKRVMEYFKMQKIFVCNSVAGHPIFGYAISHKKSKFDSLKFKNSLNQSSSPQKYQSPKFFTFSRNFQKRSGSPSQNDETNQLKSVILMARQHPGQVQSSYVLQGIVDFLMSNTQLDQVKKGYIFFVFPMINVDGVKYGHYRTNLYGVDLNRIWRLPRKQTNPEVYHLKKLLFEINRTTPISLILDIHGHSNALNSFFYGNPSKKENVSLEDPKIFPFFCSKRIKQISYKQSTFSIREQKKNSARVVLSQMFPRALVYTLQNSFYGYQSKKSKEETENKNEKQEIIEFSPQGYRKVGRQLISSYLEYIKLSQKNNSIKAKWVKEMQEMNQQIQKQKTTDVINYEKDGDSDSQLQNELIDIDQNINEKQKVLVQEPEQSPRKLYKPKSGVLTRTTFISRKSQKKKTMPLPKTICEENVRGIPSHNVRSYTTLKDINKKSQIANPFENKQNLDGKDPLDFAKKPQYPQAVLSIFKIQTQRSGLLRKKTSINSLSGYQQNVTAPQTIRKQRLSPPPNLLNRSPNKFQPQPTTKPIIQKKVRQNHEVQQKLTVQDAINKFSGMKTFFKAMGMTIQNRKN